MFDCGSVLGVRGGRADRPSDVNKLRALSQNGINRRCSSSLMIIRIKYCFKVIQRYYFKCLFLTFVFEFLMITFTPLNTSFWICQLPIFRDIFLLRQMTVQLTCAPIKPLLTPPVCPCYMLSFCFGYFVILTNTLTLLFCNQNSRGHRTGRAD